MKYGLTADQKEYDALKSIFDACGKEIPYVLSAPVSSPSSLADSGKGLFCVRIVSEVGLRGAYLSPYLLSQ